MIGFQIKYLYYSLNGNVFVSKYYTNTNLLFILHIIKTNNHPCKVCSLISMERSVDKRYVKVT